MTAGIIAAIMLLTAIFCVQSVYAAADMFIRIHTNSSTNSGVEGALTISPTRNTRCCKKFILHIDRNWDTINIL